MWDTITVMVNIWKRDSEHIVAFSWNALRDILIRTNKRKQL